MYKWVRIFRHPVTRLKLLLSQNMSNYALLRFVYIVQKYHCSNLVSTPKYLVWIKCFPPPHLEGISGCCDRSLSLSQSVRQNARMLSCSRLCELPPTLFLAHHLLSSWNVFSHYVPYTLIQSTERRYAPTLKSPLTRNCHLFHQYPLEYWYNYIYIAICMNYLRNAKFEVTTAVTTKRYWDLLRY
jgi:hypothetical protein